MICRYQVYVFSLLICIWKYYFKKRFLLYLQRIYNFTLITECMKIKSFECKEFISTLTISWRHVYRQARTKWFVRRNRTPWRKSASRLFVINRNICSWCRALFNSLRNRALAVRKLTFWEKWEKCRKMKVVWDICRY